jgi:hypothetical protein
MKINKRLRVEITQKKRKLQVFLFLLKNFLQFQ